MTPQPLEATLAEYAAQALALLQAGRAGDSAALDFLHRHTPQRRDQHAGDPPPPIALTLGDAQNAIARLHDFADWQALEQFAEAIERRDPEVYPFECVVDAVVEGDLPRLRDLLAQHPMLVHARSRRVTPFDPPIHRATLLHYIAANGTENYRQRTPPNAVEVARTLLEAGADANALASLYGGQCSTMSLLVSSSHPARAGLQVALVDLLVAYGASVHESGEGSWTNPLETALVFGFPDAALALLRHGAALTLPAAAALDRPDDVARLLDGAGANSRHRALALAAQSGANRALVLLLDAGEDLNRFNPPGAHAHTPPIHQAVWNGKFDTVRLLVERGARLDIEDKIHHSTPLGWARYAGRTEIAEWLSERGAP